MTIRDVGVRVGSAADWAQAQSAAGSASIADEDVLAIERDTGIVRLGSSSQWDELQVIVGGEPAGEPAGESLPSGWEDHADGGYLLSAPYAYLSAAGWVPLPNDSQGALTRTTYKPSDLDALFAGGKILGREGDTILVNIEFTAVPLSGGDAVLEVAIDIGGAVGRIYEHTLTFPKGAGVARNVSYSLQAYTLDTWESNGGQPVISCNRDLNVYGIRCVVGTLHRVPV